jgi:hypothetical protein
MLLYFIRIKASKQFAVVHMKSHLQRTRYAWTVTPLAVIVVIHFGSYCEKLSLQLIMEAHWVERH